MNTYIGRALNATSQWFNAVFVNGNPDVSISARIGYENYFYNNKIYKAFKWVVDTTFYPIDGKDHCKNAYLRDRKEDYTLGQGWVLGEWIMCLLLVITCIPLSVLFWSYHVIKKLF